MIFFGFRLAWYINKNHLLTRNAIDIQQGGVDLNDGHSQQSLSLWTHKQPTFVQTNSSA